MIDNVKPMPDEKNTIFLQGIAKQKYNLWGCVDTLHSNDQERMTRAMTYFQRSDLSTFEKAAFYYHEATGCKGLEFVAFSNIILKNSIQLPSGIILVPCFVDDSKLEEAPEQLKNLTEQMARNHRYVYDGWIPIDPWSEDNVRKAFRDIDEALSIFALRTRIFFEWEPKYRGTSSGRVNYYIGDSEFREMDGFIEKVESLNDDDRRALFRSLAWLSQSIRLTEPIARFLYSILAIESLVNYIERQASQESAFSKLKYASGNDGFRKIFMEHIQQMISSDSELYELLFTKSSDRKPLYDIRHSIAHGHVDATREADRDAIKKRIWDAERSAREYIQTACWRALGIELFRNQVRGTFPMSHVAAIVSSERPEEHRYMAAFYSGSYIH